MEIEGRGGEGKETKKRRVWGGHNGAKKKVWERLEKGGLRENKKEDEKKRKEWRWGGGTRDKRTLDRRRGKGKGREAAYLSQISRCITPAKQFNKYCWALYTVCTVA